MRPHLVTLVQPVVTPWGSHSLNAHSHAICGPQPSGSSTVPANPAAVGRRHRPTTGDPSAPVTSLGACLATSKVW